MPASVERTIDNVNGLLARVQKLSRSDVLIGIPKDKAARKDGTIDNATLGYIHEFGSPLRNIPARPFLFPGVKACREQAIAMLRQGARDALEGRGSVETTLNKVGMLARNSVVRAITDPEPPFVPLKAASIRARLRRTQAGRRQLKKMAKEAKQAGVRTADIIQDWGDQGNAKPLIDTGQLRASITYVIRETK